VTRTRMCLLAAIVSAAGCEGIYQRDVRAVVTGPATVAVGASVLLNVTLEYEDGRKDPLGPAGAGSVIWSTSSSAIATVDVFGVVTGVAKGSVTITATPSPFVTDGKRTPGTHNMSVQ